MQRAALYCRISQLDETVDKTENQELRLRKVAEQSGYEVAGVFIDDDISAYKGKNKRPAWLRMLAGLKEKKFDVIMATEPQRFTRGSASELEALQLFCVEAGAVMHTLSTGVQDPATPMVRAVQGILDIIGGLEVDTKTERQRNRIEDQARDGKPFWGNRPFGFEKDRLTLRDDEADAIREAYAQVLLGATFYSVAADWNKRGLRTARAGEKRRQANGTEYEVSGNWSAASVRTLLLRPSNAGLLLHRGEVVSDGLPAIVSRDDWEAINAAHKGTGTPGRRGPKVRKHLLTGLMRCYCGSLVSQNRQKVAGGYKDVYRCGSKTPLPDNGRHPTINCDAAHDAVYEQLVQETISRALTPQESTGEQSAIVALRVEQQELQRQIRVAQEQSLVPGADLQYANQIIGRLGKQVAVLQEKIDAELAENVHERMAEIFAEGFEEELAVNGDASIYELFGIKWRDLEMDDKRMLVSGTFKRITLHPTTAEHRLVLETFRE